LRIFILLLGLALSFAIPITLQYCDGLSFFSGRTHYSVPLEVTYPNRGTSFALRKNDTRIIRKALEANKLHIKKANVSVGDTQIPQHGPGEAPGDRPAYSIALTMKSGDVVNLKRKGTSRAALAKEISLAISESVNRYLDQGHLPLRNSQRYIFFSEGTGT